MLKKTVRMDVTFIKVANGYLEAGGDGGVFVVSGL